MVRHTTITILNRANYFSHLFTEKLVGVTTYRLNRSITKEVSIGINQSFQPTVEIRGGVNCVQFSQTQWEEFQNIDFNQLTSSPGTTNWGSYEILVFIIKGNTCLSIDTIGKNRVILGMNTLKRLLEIKPLINHVIQELSGLNMIQFYELAIETCARNQSLTVDDYCNGRVQCSKARIFREFYTFYKDMIENDINYFRNQL